MRRLSPAWSFLCLALALAGCVPGGLTAVNPLTGEEREFATEEEVPEGWIICASADACPAPHECETLDETSCLARTDCAPTYVGIGAYPRECDTADPPPDLCDGEAFAGCTDASPTCEESECGPAPAGATWLCPDGTVGGVTGRCVMHDAAICGWEIRDCPPPPPEECGFEECGPAPGAPAYECEDGSIGGNTGRCLRNADRTCGWEFRECPTSCGDRPVCDLACPPGTMNPIGPDGCVDSCRCVPIECTDRECGPSPDSPTLLCPDGSTGGNTGRCYRHEDGLCGWEWRECPTVECAPEDCGPDRLPPVVECRDGSTGGPTGLCVATRDGACEWEIRECPPDSCAEIPMCDRICPAGQHNPIDENGCERTCECVNDDVCADIPVCRLACPTGTHNPIDANGCVHTCECVADDTDPSVPPGR